MSTPENGRVITFGEAVKEALAEELRRDERVFLADSTSACLSSGTVVRGSTTSALISISFSISAASKATWIMLLVPTNVMSVPSRLISATPKGIVYSSSGTGPLSWYIILKKREAYRQAFANFKPETMAGFTAARIERLVVNPGIVRHRGKIEAFIHNARMVLKLQQAGLIWHQYLWSFVGGEPVLNRWRKSADIPVKTPASEAMSRDLKKRG